MTARWDVSATHRSRAPDRHVGPVRAPRGSLARLAIRARPSAGKSLILGFDGEYLSVDIAAPAVDNRANEELIRILADALDIARSRVVITRGHRGRVKSVQIDLDSRAL